ncbi:Hypothetical predicted protein [Octopus vulgaris]|uniref:Uncharacterized protein n=1 Tax=Octopus vulgaris TaxID=6645 RepID=A0AA36BLV7_OCTVU|nr:Hypothetical predicted protein [Octopus vulgaris]
METKQQQEQKITRNGKHHIHSYSNSNGQEENQLQQQQQQLSFLIWTQKPEFRLRDSVVEISKWCYRGK